MTTRKPDSNTVSDIAAFASSFIMDGDGDNGLTKLVVCSEAPQWVFDMFNFSKNGQGIVDQHRQLFIRDALALISKGKSVSNVRADEDEHTVRKWLKSDRYRRRYVRMEKNIGGSTDGIDSLRAAQVHERQEVFLQVLANVNQVRLRNRT